MLIVLTFILPIRSGFLKEVYRLPSNRRQVSNEDDERATAAFAGFSTTSGLMSEDVHRVVWVPHDGE